MLDKPYDPEKDLPLEREPFELALCKQMEDLVSQISWKVDLVRSKRESLRTRVQVCALLNSYRSLSYCTKHRLW